jgi:foldase protein PrsA
MLKRRIVALLALALTIVMASGCTMFAEDYVAKVGTEKITKSEYNFFLKDAEKRITDLFGGSAVDWNQKIPSINTTAKEYAKQVALESAVDLKVQLMRAKDAGMSLTKKEIDDINANIDSSVKGLGTTGIEQEKAIKAQAGVNVKQLKSVYQEIVLMQKFAGDVQGNYKFTDADLQTTYDALKKDGNEVVWHILIATQDAERKDFAKDKMDEAEKKANDILAKVKAGDKFADLVTQYTEDPGSKSTGGEYTISKGQMVEEFENWTFSAKDGDVGIVKSEFGFHIMKKPAFSEIKDTTIKRNYIQKRYSDDIAGWKKDKKYSVVKNDKVFDLIKVPLE